MCYIENDFLKVEVNLYAGTLKSVFDKTTGEELLWQGEERSWADRDIVIFPMIARLQDRFYEVDGKRYDMQIHGIAYYSTFEIFEQTKDSITLILTSSEQTKKVYPFDFTLKVIRRLEAKSLITTFEVTNNSEVIMPFALGGHPAIKIDYTPLDGTIDTSGNYLIFDTPKLLSLYTLNSTNEFITGLAEPEKVKKLELSKSLFKNDALIYKGFEGGLILKRRNGRQIRFELGTPPVLAFWSHAVYGGYVCIEPWFGLPDTQPSTRELAKKPLMNMLSPNQCFDYSFTVTLL